MKASLASKGAAPGLWGCPRLDMPRSCKRWAFRGRSSTRQGIAFLERVLHCSLYFPSPDESLHLSWAKTFTSMELAGRIFLLGSDSCLWPGSSEIDHLGCPYPTISSATAFGGFSAKPLRELRREDGPLKPAASACDSSLPPLRGTSTQQACRERPHASVPSPVVGTCGIKAAKASPPNCHSYSAPVHTKPHESPICSLQNNTYTSSLA